MVTPAISPSSVTFTLNRVVVAPSFDITGGLASGSVTEGAVTSETTNVPLSVLLGASVPFGYVSDRIPRFREDCSSGSPTASSVTYANVTSPVRPSPILYVFMVTHPSAALLLSNPK